MKKKILVNINEQNLELVRQLLQNKHGFKLSNSEIVDELFFDFLIEHQVISFDLPRMSIDIPDNIKNPVKKKKSDRKFHSTPPAEPRSPLRSLMDAYKESKK